MTTKGFTPSQIDILSEARGEMTDDVDRLTHQLNLIIVDQVLTRGTTNMLQPVLASLGDLDDSLLDAVADRFREQGWLVAWELVPSQGVSIYNHYKFMLHRK